MPAVRLNRRQFLSLGAISGALVLGFQLTSRGRDAFSAPPLQTEGEGAFTPNAWLRIEADETVTILVASSEMGQGVLTAVPMLIAEELGADWSRVRAEMAPAHPAYGNPRMGGRQATGGSTTIRGFWEPLRQAGAAGRTMLIAAAASRWQVDADQCHTKQGRVLGPTGQNASFGELAGEAAEQPIPELVFLKEADEFSIMGRPLPRLDTPSKVDGSAVFGQDVRLPGLLVATVARSPMLGGRMKRFEASETKAVRGVREVLTIDSGVAVVADGFWPALTGRNRLKVEWSGGDLSLSSASIRRRQAGVPESAFKEVANHGKAAAVLDKATRRVEATYAVPYLAHACMEPMNCTAQVREDGCDIWVPTQAQTSTQQLAARLTGLRPEQVRVHTTFLGGGFGRRSEIDFVTDALQIAMQLGRPVKVLWTREDDMRNDFYRPATHNRLSAALDEQGKLVAWSHDIAGPSILARVAPDAVASGIDGTSIEGAANLPYAIPHFLARYAMVNDGASVGFWRSVGSSQNAYVTECFLDEVAAAAGRDPYQFRRQLLADKPRHRRVLETAAQAAGWEHRLPPGRFRGIALAESFGSIVAEVAEVSLREGQVRVHRVVCAVDCGMVVNPDIVTAQMESGINCGLGAALKGEITLNEGRIQQSNFHDYPLPRMDEAPEIEVHIVPSGEAPGGVGEPGTPPLAPAVANAVFAATGQPVRALPIRLADNA